MKKMLPLSIFFICNLTFVSLVYTQETSWNVGYYGSLRNKAANINNDEGTFIVDEDVCHLDIWRLKYLTSKEEGIRASIDGQKAHVFDYKAKGTDNAIMTFKATNQFIAHLKKGNNIHISYRNNDRWNEITFTLNNSSKSIAEANDGHSYNLESRSLEKTSLMENQKWKEGIICETTVGFSEFTPHKMWEWIQGPSPVDPYARLNRNIKLYEGYRVKVNMTSKRTHPALRPQIVRIYFYEVEYDNNSYWVIDGAIKVDGKILW